MRLNCLSVGIWEIWYSLVRILALICAETCVMFIFILCIYEARDLHDYFSKGHNLRQRIVVSVLGWVQTARPLENVTESIKMCRWSWLLAEPSSDKMTAWSLADGADILGKEWWSVTLQGAPCVLCIKQVDPLCCSLSYIHRTPLGIRGSVRGVNDFLQYHGRRLRSGETTAFCDSDMPADAHLAPPYVAWQP